MLLTKVVIIANIWTLSSPAIIGNLDTVKAAIEAGAKPDEKTLWWVEQGKNPEIIALLQKLIVADNHPEANPTELISSGSREEETIAIIDNDGNVDLSGDITGNIIKLFRL